MDTAETRRARRAEQKARKELRSPPTREDIYELLNKAREVAQEGSRPNLNAALKAIELLGKTQGVFVDVQKVEVTEKDSATFLAELDEAILNDSEFRNHIRGRLAEIDARGTPVVGGEDPSFGLLSPPGAPSLFPRGYRH